MLLWFGYPPVQLEDPSFNQFLDEAAKIDTPGVRAGIADAKLQAAKNIAWLHDFQNGVVHRPAPSPAMPPGTPRVTFSPLALSAVDEDGQPLNAPEIISSWLIVGDRIDAVFDANSLYLMKEKGTLQRLFSSEEECFRSSKPAFDGRFLWAPVVQKDDGEVLVVDPAEARIVARFSKTDGLPPMTNSAIAAALEPGRACVSGGFGRGWIATLSLNPDGVKKIHVFFEAKYQPDRNVFGDKKELHTAFSPDYVYVLHGNDAQNKPITRLLIGRSESYHPLIVDPDSETVGIFDYPLLLGEPSSDVANDNGQIFTALRNSDSWTLGSITRYSMPDLKPVVICQLQAFGPMTFFNGQVHILGQHWMTANAPEGPYSSLAGAIPGHEDFRKLFHSCHYGLVLSLYNSDRGVFAVQLPQNP
jgi:hypothetical protein